MKVMIFAVTEFIEGGFGVGAGKVREEAGGDIRGSSGEEGYGKSWIDAHNGGEGEGGKTADSGGE